VCILSLSIDRDIFYANNVLHLILLYQTYFILCENNVTHDNISYKSWLPLIILKVNQMVNMFFICTQIVNIQRFYYTNDIILHFFLLYFLGQSNPTPAEGEEMPPGNNNNVDNEIIKFILQLGYFWS
jgi:hypothetical protein